MKWFRRWSWTAWPLGALVFAVAVASAVAPDSLAVEAAWLRNWGEGEERQLTFRIMALRDSAEVYHAAWKLADSRERAARELPAPIGLTIRVDRGVPSVAARRYRDVLEAEWKRAVPEPQARVIVRVVDDTLDDQAWRSVVIPVDSTQPCVVYLHLPRGSKRLPEVPSAEVAAPGPRLRSARVVALEKQRLGACALYGRFGYPGRGMRDWLTRTQMRTAALHTATMLEPPVSDAELRRGRDLLLFIDAIACAAGTHRMCADFLEGAELAPVTWRPYREDALPTPRRLTNAQRVATFSENSFDFAQRPNRLASLRATIGDDRFRVLWLADGDPYTVFRSREGAPLEELISTSLRSPTYSYRPGNTVRGASLLVVLGLIGVALGLSLRFTKRLYRAPI